MTEHDHHPSDLPPKPWHETNPQVSQFMEVVAQLELNVGRRIVTMLTTAELRQVEVTMAMCSDGSADPIVHSWLKAIIPDLDSIVAEEKSKLRTELAEPVTQNPLLAILLENRLNVAHETEEESRWNL